MKRSPDNQINASFIDISRIKWLVFFLLRSSFFRTTRPLASSEATAYYRPAPGRTDGIPERDQRPCDNGYKSVFTNSWLVRQRHRSWIKGLGKNPQKEWTRSLLAVPFVRGAPTVTPRDSRETMACIHVNRHDGTCLQVFRQNTQKSECRIGRPNKNLRVYTASDANWLKTHGINFLVKVQAWYFNTWRGKAIFSLVKGTSMGNL